MSTTITTTPTRTTFDGSRPVHGRLTRELGGELHRLAGSGGGAGTAALHLDDEAAAANLADTLLRDAVRERATDIHFDPTPDGLRVRLRIDGVLFDAAGLSRPHGERIVRHFKVRAGMDAAGAFRPADARLTETVDGREVDLRLASAPCVGGEKLAVRLLDRRRAGQSLQDLGLARSHRWSIEHWLNEISGMFLVAGPTNSGKTTTLYALLHELRLRERSVVTIEDPVEYQIDGVVQMQVDRRHGLTFAEGLRSMLRLDPDYLQLGEIRDADAARAAVEAAGSGRVLMSTLHSPDAVGAVTVLRNYGLRDHEVATSLRVVVGQRLVRRLCKRCCRQQAPGDDDYEWLAAAGLPPHPAGAEFMAPVGCDGCRGLGYDGRIGLFEVWHVGPGDYDRLLAGADERALRAGAADDGLRTLIHDGYAKVTDGVTSLAELRHVAASYPLFDGSPAASRRKTA